MISYSPVNIDHLENVNTTFIDRLYPLVKYVILPLCLVLSMLTFF